MGKQLRMADKPDPYAFFDEEERELIESFEAALEDGRIVPKSKEEIAALNARWQKELGLSAEKKPITLRLQERDITKLKSMAARKGLPYQTLVASVLHQFANGDLIER
jgi:predicted DNA binding CopG/RHH family protein